MAKNKRKSGNLTTGILIAVGLILMMKKTVEPAPPVRPLQPITQPPGQELPALSGRRWQKPRIPSFV